MSSNWSGYAVTGNTYTSVSGSWIAAGRELHAARPHPRPRPLLGRARWQQRDLDRARADRHRSRLPRERHRTLLRLVRARPAPRSQVAADRQGRRPDRRVRQGQRHAGHAHPEEPARPASGSRRRSDGLSRHRPRRSGSPRPPRPRDPRRRQILPLTDFGTVRFTSATATSTSGHTGTISDAAWSATRIVLDLRVGGGPGPGPFGHFAPETAASTVGRAERPRRAAAAPSAITVAVEASRSPYEPSERRAHRKLTGTPRSVSQRYAQLPVRR